MLNSNVPFVCSLLLALVVPSAANSGLAPLAKTRMNMETGSSPIEKTVSFALPGQDEMPYVHSYIQENDESLLAVKQRSKRYFKMIETVLQRFGLPAELKYLAVIESDLKSTATSRVGARGPWQLMASTAQDLGLKVDSAQDERTNFYKSTRAAALYLRDLHRTFKDWRLVLAAYNAGPLPVFRAMQRSKSTDFRVLERYLPSESRTHVKRFMATAYYFDALSA
ncbi:MAG TPA: lytic transglycosylase domain-containing protein [Puia sp.]|uniref:lytic transglycosylase domain-containing protein n=1 Tax=Puia sp. TaxID=2045100 RepID=UPI002D190762|nr:lytic transglycosylase domain-containing protein [Puia sp.]HVU99637.1 lytic transglycosylase domain-containing protein [Puia sp.]